MQNDACMVMSNRLKEIHQGMQRAWPDMSDCLARAVRRIASVTDSPLPEAYLAPTEPVHLDAFLDQSVAYAYIRETVTELTVGSDNLQHWIGATRSAGTIPMPSREEFHDFSGPDANTPRVKPWEKGLYTSSPLSLGYSLWRIYLRGWEGSSLLPLPAYTWEVVISRTARIYLVDSASAWAALLNAYPLVHEERVYPDWASIATSYDGVHITFPFVIGTQGLSVVTDKGPSAPCYWDVETTYWLNWVVQEARCIGEVEPPKRLSDKTAQDYFPNLKPL